MTATAQHRPAVRRRRFAHDDLVAVDLFSGFGGLTQGINRAGFTTIMAANHNPYKVEVHEANHPEAEHWIADLVDPESSDYHSVRELPAADLLAAGVSCVNHSHANS
jgi:site-specific DNA-cytosine methylase